MNIILKTIYFGTRAGNLNPGVFQGSNLGPVFPCQLGTDLFFFLSVISNSGLSPFSNQICHPALIYPDNIRDYSILISRDNILIKLIFKLKAKSEISLRFIWVVFLLLDLDPVFSLRLVSFRVNFNRFVSLHDTPVNAGLCLIIRMILSH